MSFPITTVGFVFLLWCLVRTKPAAKPIFTKKSGVIGKDPVFPLIPSVPKNFFVLTKSEDSINNIYEQKIFYPAKKIQELNTLDNYPELEKISENLVMGPDEIIGIAEYGVTNEMSLSAMEAITQEQNQVLFTSSVS